MNKEVLKKNKVFGINLLYILSIIPVICYAFYKNGILVSKHGHITTFLSLQYIVIPLVMIVLSYVFEIYYYMVIKKDDDLHNAMNSVVPYINTLCYLVCAPLDHLWLTIPIIIVLDILLKILDDKITVNQVALFKCILFGVLTVMGLYNNTYNANNYELVANLNPSLTQAFIGNVVGEIGVTSAFLSLVGFVILLFNSYYKKEITIISILSYAIVSAVVFFVSDLTFKELMMNTFASGVIFALVFVASLVTSTPVVKSGCIIYSLVVGIASAVCVNVFNFNIGIYIAILVCSILVPLFNKFKMSLD